MKSNDNLPMPHLFLVSLLLSFSWPTLGDTHQQHGSFLQCLSRHPSNSDFISTVIYTPINSSFSSVFAFSLRNARVSTPTTLRPLAIVTPSHVSHIQATVNCSRSHGLQVRIRSGGHDYEGLSYVSQVPFVIIDLINLRSIDVDTENNTAWIQAGATIGEVYYRIAEKTATLAFPAGICPTVGVGGHFSGGGYGMLMRKYGLAADQIIDAELVDVNGKLLDRNSMGEDLFWAIRGGGGASFGVVVAWKVNLVTVPSTVTVFTVNRTLEENGTMLVHKWQSIAPKINEDLYIRLFLRAVNSSRQDGTRTIQASFTSLYLGRTDDLLPLMQESFPELGITRQDCIEMSWIQSILYFAEIPQSEPLEILLNRTGTAVIFKGKSDYVTEPIPETGLEGLWQWFFEDESLQLIFSPYGGNMDDIPESESPYPHRAGNLFNIHYAVGWGEEDAASSQWYINFMRRLYGYMKPYVSKSPRRAYMNYRDLDLGTNNNGVYTSYKQASKWGLPYFNKNFNRLIHVKSLVDPGNFFRHEQSIPLFRR
ncbi:Inactive tetrahydrocannabinolic acid synthase [Hibiscus syriacus]|uniref:Inactive tetrahydrocannabinolic acid synthase n=1 Tax=Hibiscus syriacus TaxID=106335 RepID=A0A6A2ZUX2_HIBSY|nr:berberine bridge enzyme-like 18 [Hibiscus syriacus]KAE8694962.1 Inactive tetrahydrocannabinolic acid synthase [Hibiscus syriacus]